MQLRMQTREFLHKFPRESQEALYTKKGSTRIHLISVVVDGKKETGLQSNGLEVSVLEQRASS